MAPCTAPSKAAATVWSLQPERTLPRSALSNIYIDVDHFEPVSDSYGHLVGDRLLRQWLRRVDVVGHRGGEEFAVVIPGTSLAAGRSRGWTRCGGSFPKSNTSPAPAGLL